LRGRRRIGDRDRRRCYAGECHAAQCSKANKCRNKFHDIHLLTSIGGEQGTTGSVHYCELTSMNKSRAFQFLISTFRTARSSRPTNLHADGGFDADDVMVAVSLPVVVLHAHPRRPAPRQTRTSRS
jgi:hypothetical protein